MNRRPPVHWGNKFNLGRKHLKPFMTKKRLAIKARLEAYEKENPKKPKPRVELAMKNPYKVEPGQVWVNVDKRAGTNSKAGPVAVQIVRVEPPYAYCYWADAEGKVDFDGDIKMSRIRLDYFRAAEPRATRYGGGARGWRRLVVDQNVVA